MLNFQNAPSEQNETQLQEKNSMLHLLYQLNAVKRMKNPTILRNLRSKAQEAIKEYENKKDELEKSLPTTTDVLDLLAFKKEITGLQEIIEKIQSGLTAIADRAIALTSAPKPIKK